MAEPYLGWYLRENDKVPIEVTRNGVNVTAQEHGGQMNRYALDIHQGRISMISKTDVYVKLHKENWSLEWRNGVIWTKQPHDQHEIVFPSGNSTPSSPAKSQAAVLPSGNSTPASPAKSQAAEGPAVSVIRNAIQAPAFALHEIVEVYSNSQAAWMAATVIDVLSDGSVQVQYNKVHATKNIPREHLNPSAGFIRKQAERPVKDSSQAVSCTKSMWSAGQAFDLGAKPDLNNLAVAAQVLSKEWLSVSRVVDAANTGSLIVNGGICVVFSERLQSYWLVWREDQKHQAQRIRDSQRCSSKSKSADLKDDDGIVASQSDVSAPTAHPTRVMDVKGEKNIRNPIFGLKAIRLVSLAVALGNIVASGLLDEEACKTVVFLAYSFADDKLSSGPDPNQLSRDEIAAIHAYSQASKLYEILNESLREECRDHLKPFFAYIVLLVTALFKLPIRSGVAYRGVKIAAGELKSSATGKPMYEEGKHVIWWSFSSSTASVAVLKSDLFLGAIGPRTLFNLTLDTGFDIREYSAVSHEDEIISLPGTSFKVNSVLPQGDLTIVQMEEETGGPLLIDFDRPACKPATKNAPVVAQEKVAAPSGEILPSSCGSGASGWLCIASAIVICSLLLPFAFGR